MGKRKKSRHPWGVAVALGRRCSGGFLRLLRLRGAMFAARSSPGRYCKLALFGLGVILPLGSLIWAALAWHGLPLIAPVARLAPVPGPSDGAPPARIEAG